MPAKSTTLNSTALVALFKVTFVQLMAVPLALAVMSVQVLPLSSEPYKMSPGVKAADRVAVMVCAAVLVMRSVLLAPVSALKATALTVSVGATVSRV